MSIPLDRFADLVGRREKLIHWMKNRHEKNKDGTPYSFHLYVSSVKAYFYNKESGTPNLSCSLELNSSIMEAIQVYADTILDYAVTSELARLDKEILEYEPIVRKVFQDVGRNY